MEIKNWASLKFNSVPCILSICFLCDIYIYIYRVKIKIRHMAHKKKPVHPFFFCLLFFIIFFNEKAND